MESDGVRIHCEDWKQPYSPEVHFLIQEQGSDIVGSMLRHPHDKQRLIIQYRDIGPSLEKEWKFVSYSYAGINHL